jgi:hypothetical protein
MRGAVTNPEGTPTPPLLVPITWRCVWNRTETAPCFDWFAVQHLSWQCVFLNQLAIQHLVKNWIKIC